MCNQSGLAVRSRISFRSVNAAADLEDGLALGLELQGHIGVGVAFSVLHNVAKVVTIAARAHAEYEGPLDGRIHLLIRVATIIIASILMTRHLKGRLLPVLGSEVRIPLRHRGMLRRRDGGHTARCRCLVVRLLIFRVRSGVAFSALVMFAKLVTILGLASPPQRATADVENCCTHRSTD
jgi:hypothetical protein